MHLFFVKGGTYIYEKSDIYNYIGCYYAMPITYSFCRNRTANYNVPLVKTQMKKIIVTAKTLYSHPKNVSKIYAALHTDLAW